MAEALDAAAPGWARPCPQEDAMAFKPNYRQQRSERTRSKEAKKQEKLAKREADAARRRAEREAAGLSPEGDDATGADREADRGGDDAAADRGAEDRALAERETDDSKADAQDPGAGLERTKN
jgi:hypothetical protein